jgi:AP-3 complex subunit beta
MSLAALQFNAARLGQRLSETISESTRDLPALANGLNGGGFDILTTEEKIAQVKKQLDSNSEREKLDALKKLLGTLSKPATLTSGQHSAFFPLVVKNVASTSLEVRKLVYIYLLRFAHLEPDLALLSINTFQKDLGDPNPLIRAMALRLLSGIGSKVSVIQAVVLLAVKKCAADTSPYVRKSAALSLIKCYE